VEAGTVFTSKPAGGSADLTFTRSNDTATRVGPNGYIEKVRTNLLLQSNSFDTTWGNTRSTESNGYAGYDGTNNAWKLEEDSNTGTHFIEQNVSSGAAVHTISCYFKAAERSGVQLLLEGSSSYAFANFNLSTGAVQSTGDLGSFTLLDAKITSVGGGWYRCSVSASTGVATTWFKIYTLDAGFAPSYTGTTGEGIYFQNSMLEVGDIATDYIETTTAAVSVGPVANVPRINFDPVLPRTGSLLLEPQRTNLNTYSEDISQAQYGKNRCTVSANSVVSPDGYTNADKIVQDPSNTAWGGLTQVYSPTGPATLSVFAKKIDNDYIAILGHAINPTAAWFNIANGTVGTTEANVTSASIEAYPNGWYRCSITATTVTRFNVLHASSDGGNTAPVNSETALWGFQVEDSASYPTSYIPTYSAAATRGADTASKTGISSVIGQTEGTLFIEMKDLAWRSSALRLIGISDGTTQNRVILLTGQTSDTLRAIVTTGNVLQTSTTQAATFGNVKLALAYSSAGGIVYLNGSPVLSFGPISVPSCSALYIQTVEDGTSLPADGKTAQALLFQTRLTNDQLSQITTL